MPRLLIQRISEFENRARRIKIEVNGKLAARIKNGELLELELPAGKHFVQAKIDWCSSNLLEVQLDDSSKTELELKSAEGSSLIRILFRPSAYLKLFDTNA